MAGSLNHIVGSDGRFRMDCIDNLGDASEALEECYSLIYELSGGDTGRVSVACRKYGFPDPWEDRYHDDHKEPMIVERS